MGVTIKEVAQHAGVSIATVSRILNDRPGFKPATKQKVLEAIDELGYRPNALARGLVNKRTKTIGVIFPTVSSMFSAEILRGVEEAVHAAGWSAIVCNTDSSTEKTLQYLELLIEKRVEGILFVSDLFTAQYEECIHQASVPAVLVSTISYSGLPYVKVDDRMAAFSATDYLIKQGHRKICIVNGGKDDAIAGIPRMEGYKQAFRHHGLAFEPEWLIYSEDFSFQSGRSVYEQVINSGTTAVFACSDELAAGILSEAHRHSVAVPEELSVMGYDNLLIAEMAIPPLTTVSQPLFEMGKKAVGMLFQVMDGSTCVPNCVMPHQIISRESVLRLI